MALKPSYAMAQSWLGAVLRFSGRVPEALEVARLAKELDPLGSFSGSGYGETLQMLGRWNEARAFYDEAGGGHGRRTLYAREMGLREESAGAEARLYALGLGYGEPERTDVVGRAIFVPSLRDSASAVLVDMEAQGISRRELATLSAAIGDLEGALRLLEGAKERGDPLLNASVEPVFDPLRSDARFQRVLAELALPNCDAACRTGAPARPSSRAP